MIGFVVILFALSIFCITYILSKDTKNNNTKLIIGVFLLLIGIVSYALFAHEAAANFSTINTPHYVFILLVSCSCIIIGIIGIAKALISNK